MGSNHKCATLVWDVANGGDYAYVEAGGFMRNLCTFLSILL